MADITGTSEQPHRRPRLLAVTSELPWPLDTGGHLRSDHSARPGPSLRRHARRRRCRPGAAGVSRLSGDGIRVAPVRLPARHRVTEGARMAKAALTSQASRSTPGTTGVKCGGPFGAKPAAVSPHLLYLDHLDSFQFARVAGEVPTVVDCHNVYSVLVRRQADESHRGLARLYLLREARLLEKMERQAARHTRGLFAVSVEDAQVFRSFGAENVSVVPNGVDCGVYAGLAEGRKAEPPLMLYVGAMSWAPNANAAVFLARAGPPRREAVLPDARLRIVGRNPPAAVTES